MEGKAQGVGELRQELRRVAQICAHRLLLRQFDVLSDLIGDALLLLDRRAVALHLWCGAARARGRERKGRAAAGGRAGGRARTAIASPIRSSSISFRFFDCEASSESRKPS